MPYLKMSSRAIIFLALLAVRHTIAVPHPAKAFIFNSGQNTYPSVLISPAFYTSNEATLDLNFTSVSLKGNSILDHDVLHSSSTLTIPSFSLPAGAGVTFVSPNGSIGGGDTMFDKLWAVTYPLSCGNLNSSTGDDIKLSSLAVGNEEPTWGGHSLEGSLNLTVSGGRYLGGIFSSQRLPPSFPAKAAFAQYDAANFSSTMYSFGGMCVDDAETISEVSRDRLSSDIWKFTNSSVVGNMTLQLANNTSPPVPEAGFSLTDLPPKYSLDGAQSMLVLGGFSADSQFIGFKTAALYNLPSETWAYLNVNVSEAANADPRAGHSAVLSKNATKIVIFGGWVGDVNTPADPPLLVLEISATPDKWKLTVPSPNKSSFAPKKSLWGHAAVMLNGDIMLVTSGFPAPSGIDNAQEINNKTYYYNLTSNSWIESYTAPRIHLAGPPPRDGFGDQNLAILSSVIGGLLGITTAICFVVYRGRKKYFVYNKLSKPRKVKRSDRVLDIDSDAGLIDYNSGSMLSRPPKPRYTYRSRSDDTDPLKIYSRNLRFARHLARQEEIKENARLQQELLENEKQERQVAAWVVHHWNGSDHTAITTAASNSTYIAELGTDGEIRKISPVDYESDNSKSTQKSAWDFNTDRSRTAQSSSENSSWPNAYPASSVYSLDHQETIQQSTLTTWEEEYDNSAAALNCYGFPTAPLTLSTPQQAYRQFTPSTRDPFIVITSPESTPALQQEPQNIPQESGGGLTRNTSTASSSSFTSIFSRFELDREILSVTNNGPYPYDSLTPTQHSLPHNSSVNYGSWRTPMHSRVETLRSDGGSRSNLGSVKRYNLTRQPSSNYGSYNSTAARQLAMILSQSPELPESPRLPVQRQHLQTPVETFGGAEIALPETRKTTSPNLMVPAMRPGITVTPPPDAIDGDPEVCGPYGDQSLSPIRMGSFSIFECQFENDNDNDNGIEEVAPLTVSKKRNGKQYHEDTDGDEVVESDCLPFSRRRRFSQQNQHRRSSSNAGATTKSFWENVRNRHLRRNKGGFSPRLELEEKRHEKTASGGSSRSISGVNISWPVKGTVHSSMGNISPLGELHRDDDEVHDLPVARPAMNVRNRSISSSLKRHGASIMSRGKSWSSSNSSSSASGSTRRRRRKRLHQSQQDQTQLVQQVKIQEIDAPRPMSARLSQYSLSPNTLFRDTLESGSIMDGDDFERIRVVQVMFTAPRGPLRIVNGSPSTFRKGSYGSSVSAPLGSISDRIASIDSINIPVERMSAGEQIAEQRRQQQIRLQQERQELALAESEAAELERERNAMRLSNVYDSYKYETDTQRQQRERSEQETRLRYGLGIGYAV